MSQEVEQLKAVIKVLGETLQRERHLIGMKHQEDSGRVVASQEVSVSEYAEQEIASLTAEVERLRVEMHDAQSANNDAKRQIKHMEDELYEAECEKASIQQQLTEQAKIFAQQQAALEQGGFLLQEKDASAHALKEQTRSLSEEKELFQAKIEALIEKNGEYQGLITSLNSSIHNLQQTLLQEREQQQVASSAYAELQTVVHQVQVQLQQTREAFEVSQQQNAAACQERDMCSERTFEVEQLLVAKLRAIADLEEESAAHTAYIHELEKKVMEKEQLFQQEHLILQKAQDSISSFQQISDQHEQHRQKLMQDVAELQERCHVFEVLRRTVLQASSQAHTIAELCDAAMQALTLRKTGDQCAQQEPS